jgi:hypothetical protein
MSIYALYNGRFRRHLTHPRVGLWYTHDPDEAADMLEAARRYVRSFGVPGYEDDIVLVDISPGREPGSAPA